MQPSSREMQEAMNSLLNQQQQQLHDLQNHQFDPTTSSHEDFLEQIMLSSIPTTSSWPPQWDPLSSQTPLGSLQEQSALLANKLRQHQIAGGAAKALTLQQQLMLSRGMAAAENCLRSPPGPGGSNSGLLPLPLSLAGDGDRNDVIVDGSPFKSANNNPVSEFIDEFNYRGNDASVQALYNGFTGSLGQPSNQPQHFHQPHGGGLQAQSFGAQAAPATNQSTASGGSTATAGGGGTPAQPRQQRVRARRGQATDPHSIAERLRRERIAERMKALQEIVPNANKTDKASMLDEIIDYVKFLQLQVKVLSMSRLGGAAAVAPLAADMSSEKGGGGDCASNGPQTASSSNNSDSMTITEHQVAKLMEEDMGSAMQYLQGKGLCLMPISLATAISTATCNSRNPMNPGFNVTVNNPLHGVGAAGSNVNGVGEAGGPSSPSLSVLTVQSATVGNGGGGGSEPSSVKDATSVCKP